MKITTATLVLGIFIAFLGLFGLITGEGRVAGEMNIDFLLDIARIGLGALLTFSALHSANASRTALTIFSAAYLGMFVAGILSPTLFGITPNGLGTIDHVLHVAGGILGLFIARFENQNRFAM